MESSGNSRRTENCPQMSFKRSWSASNVYLKCMLRLDVAHFIGIKGIFLIQSVCWFCKNWKCFLLQWCLTTGLFSQSRNRPVSTSEELGVLLRHRLLSAAGLKTEKWQQLCLALPLPPVFSPTQRCDGRPPLWSLRWLTHISVSPIWLISCFLLLVQQRGPAGKTPAWAEQDKAVMV